MSLPQGTPVSYLAGTSRRTGRVLVYLDESAVLVSDGASSTTQRLLAASKLTDLTPPPPPPVPVRGPTPDVPAGYQLVEGKTLTSVTPKTAYRDCTFPGGLAIRDLRDIWFDQCRMPDGFYIYGLASNIQAYRSDIKGPGDNDGMQIWSNAIGSPPPSQILLQDCLVHDVVKGHPDDHPDGLQVGGVTGLTLRRCEFKNIDVQPIFVNGWTAPCTDVLVEECKVWAPTPTGYFSIIIGTGEVDNRTTNALVKNCRVGAPVRIADGYGAAPPASRNCREEGTINDPALG